MAAIYDTGQLHCTGAGLSPSFHPNELTSNEHSHFLEKLEFDREHWLKLEFDREHWLKLERNSEEFNISPLCSFSIFINFEIRHSAKNHM